MNQHFDLGDHICRDRSLPTGKLQSPDKLAHPPKVGPALLNSFFCVQDLGRDCLQSVLPCDKHNENMRFLFNFQKLHRFPPLSHHNTCFSKVLAMCKFIVSCFIIISCVFRVVPVAYGGSQARDQIRPVAASLRHSYGNAGS